MNELLAGVLIFLLIIIIFSYLLFVISKNRRKELTKNLRESVNLWAKARTNSETPRRKDLIRDKTKAIGEFFDFAGVEIPNDIMGVSPAVVAEWIDELRGRGLAASTIYGKVSRLSSYFGWLVKEIPGLSNPVDMVRPEAPEAYSSESVKALNVNDLKNLLEVARSRAEHSLPGKRDYAILLLYVLTGMRRSEVVSLRAGDIETNGGMTIHFRQKGGEYLTREIRDPSIKRAIDDYLEASGRTNLKDDSPLWTRHDKAGEPGEALTSHAVDKNLRACAKRAGLKAFHINQLRHTFAMMAAKNGSLWQISDALGHNNLKTTRIYVRNLGTRKDRFSEQIRFDLGIKQT